MRRFLWRISVRAPRLVWLAAVLGPLAYGVFLFERTADVSVGALEQNVEQSTDQVRSLQQQLEGLQQRQAAAGANRVASGDVIRRLMRYRCGLSHGYQIVEENNRLRVTFSGAALAGLCVLRSLQGFPGGIYSLQVNAGERVHFTWEGNPS